MSIVHHVRSRSARGERDPFFDLCRWWSINGILMGKVPQKGA